MASNVRQSPGGTRSATPDARYSTPDTLTERSDPQGYATGWGVAWLVAVACGSWAAGEGDLLDAVLRGLTVGGGVMALWVTGLFFWIRGVALDSRGSEETDGMRGHLTSEDE